SIRSVTKARASITPRGEMIVAQPPFSSPRFSASTGSTSTNRSGCSSARYGKRRLIEPEVYISVNRYVENTTGYTSEPGSPAIGRDRLSGRLMVIRVGDCCWLYKILRADEVELLLAANDAANPKPLSVAASGGELSRVTLALEVILSAGSAG